MKKFAHLRLICAGLFLALAVSAALPISALADDGTPPTEPAPPVEEEPAEEAPAADATQEAQAAEEAVVDDPALTVEDSAPVEQEPALLTDLPEGTEVVVLDEQGDMVALASSEAAEIIAGADPIWCPASVAVPNPSTPGCTASFTSLAALITFLDANEQAMDGTIWLEKTFDSGDVGADPAVTVFSIDGTNFTTMRNFKLNIKGGWNGCNPTCVGTIDMSTPSELNGSLHINGWLNDVTISDLLITGTTTGNALEVITTKNIVLTRVTVDTNTGGRGASLVNNNGGGTGNVTVTNGTFTNNTDNAQGYGLYIASNGTITLSNIVATGNDRGALIGNNGAPVVKNVILSGTLDFSSNQKYGLYVTSDGSITAANLTANYNGIVDAGGDGATFDNSTSPTDLGLTLTGINIFLGNYDTGLYLITHGTISANSVYASSNINGIGAHINNAGASILKAVTFTGTNEFKNNGDQGIRILAAGPVTLNNVTASLNGIDGVEISNQFLANAAVSLTGTNVFLNNAVYGLDVYSFGAISLNTATANYNALGVSLNNQDAATPQNVTVSGVNTFSNNTASGLYVQSRGIITVNSVTASNNGSGYGAYLYNNTGVNNLMKGINVTGTNVFNSNNLAGLTTGSFGPITVNNVTANNNSGGTGIHLYNLLASTPQAITVNGVNSASSNFGTGMNVVTKGAIKVNSLTANLNGIGASSGYGAYLDNSAGVAASAITLTGTNVFNDNYTSGLIVNAAGPISLNNITANNNTQGVGATISNTVLTNLFPQNVTLSGTNAFNGNYLGGVEITTHGMITANNLNASSNGTASSIGYGAHLINNTAATAKSVTLTGTNVFNGNYYEGLYLISKGAITASNVTADGSLSEDGAALSNDTAGSPQNVTLTGINHFSGNFKNGVEITSVGAISISSVTASGNGLSFGYGNGAYLRNQTSTLPQNVTISGTNVFNANRTYGFDVMTKGTITGNNITAGGNMGGFGATLNNNEGLTTSAKGVTLSGTNAFSNNTGTGLNILSYGPISINSVTAGSNTGMGASLDNSGATGAPQKVAITGTNTFNINLGAGGLYIATLGQITGNNITASSSSGGYGAGFYNNSSALPQLVTLTGTNVFSSNLSYGIQIYSKGAITINNLTASNNTGFGANLVNGFGLDTSAQGVKLTGTNVFNNNSAGLLVTSYGAISGNNITANSNTSGDGANLGNSFSAGPQNVTLTGTNNFGTNAGIGLNISSLGAISLSNIHADDNGTDGTGSGASITNNASALPQNVTISGINTFSLNGDSGLEVYSKGVITLSSATANGNDDFGAVLQNNSGATNLTKGVTLTGTNQFSSNIASDGLRIFSYGPVSVNAVTANLNGQFGANISNTGATNPQKVAFTGVNTFNQNTLSGLNVNTKGAITSATSLTASSNSVGGAQLYNTIAGAVGGISLLGTNTFSNNLTASGLLIDSVGAITLNNVTASVNGDGVGDNGADLNNTFAPSLTPMNVTLTGVNVFSDNHDLGLTVVTEGAISLNSVTANYNDGMASVDGVLLDNTATEGKTVTLSGTNTFTGNTGNGLHIFSHGAITLNNINAIDNNVSGADIQNQDAAAPQFVKLTGTNVFTLNTDTGLQVLSDGAISVNNLTASGNSNGGALLENDEPGATAASTVTLTGVHFFNDNTNLGLRIRSISTVTLSKLTADNNSAEGLEIETTGAVTLACASITSNGSFGIDIVNALSLTLKGVISSGNTGGDLNYVGTPIIVRTCP